MRYPAKKPPPVGCVDRRCRAGSRYWNSLYSQVLGLVDQGLQVGVRGSDLNALPPSTPLFDNVRYDSFSLYLTDSWELTPTLTFNYGLNWSVDIPPVDQTGKQSVSMTAPGNTVIIPENYLASREQAALNGQVYNPTVEFGPLPFSQRKYPYDLVWNTVAPRVALAWTPKFGGGKLVIRGGYGQLFDRLNGVQKEFQAFGFQQSLTCLGPSRTGQCLGSLGSDPLTGFRIGVDGSTVPIPALSASATPPLIPGSSAVPGANQPIANTTYQIDPTYRPGRNHNWDLTIQREMPGKSLLEIGYIGRHANNIYNPLEVNGVPWMMTLNGQSYAQAYDAVAAQLAAGAAVTPQPFLESALAGSSFCTAPMRIAPRAWWRSSAAHSAISRSPRCGTVFSRPSTSERRPPRRARSPRPSSIGRAPAGRTTTLVSSLIAHATLKR